MIQHRQLASNNRSRSQQQHRQPFASKALSEQMRSSCSSSSTSATSSSINQLTYSAAPAFSPQASSINQCNFQTLTGGRNTLNRNAPLNSSNHLNRGLSTPLISGNINCQILNSASAFDSSRPISLYDQAKSISASSQYSRSYQGNNSLTEGTMESFTNNILHQGGRKLNSGHSSSTTDSEDETDDIIVDVEQVYVSQQTEELQTKVENSTLPSQRRSATNQPSDKLLKYRLASGSSQVQATRASPMNQAESFEIRVDQNDGQQEHRQRQPQNDDNFLAAVYHSSHLFPNNEHLLINPAFYATQSLCDLPQTSVGSSPDLRSNQVMPTSCNLKRSHPASHLDKHAFSTENANRNLLSNFKTTNLQSNASSSSSSTSDSSTNQVLKDHQLRNSIFASFLSQLSGSIESQALISLLLKNNGLLDQKLHHQDQQQNQRHHNHQQEQQQQQQQRHQHQQIKQSSANNSQRTYIDTTKAILTGLGPTTSLARAAAAAMVSNNGAIQLSGMTACADVGPSSSSVSFNTNESSCRTNLGNSPPGSCHLVHHNLNHGLTIYNQSVNIPSAVSTPSLVVSKGGSSTIDINNKLEQIETRKPPMRRFNHTGMMTGVLPSRIDSPLNSLLSASSTNTMPMVPRMSNTMSRSKHVSSSLNTELLSPSSPPSSKQLQPLPFRTISTSTSIDFKNIDSLIAPISSFSRENHSSSTNENQLNSMNSNSIWQESSSDTILNI